VLDPLDLHAIQQSKDQPHAGLRQIAAEHPGRCDGDERRAGATEGDDLTDRQPPGQGHGRNNGSIYDTNGDGRIDGRDRAAQSNCAWYDINCAGVNSRNTRNDGRNSTGWQLIGRDLDGYSLYERRIYERNGKSTIETARQLPNGRMKIIDKRKVDDRYITRNGRIDQNRDGIDDRYERNGRR